MKELSKNRGTRLRRIFCEMPIPGGYYLSQAPIFEEKFGSVFLRFNYGCFTKSGYMYMYPFRFLWNLGNNGGDLGPYASGATIRVLKQTDWGKFWIIWDDIGLFPSIFNFTPSNREMIHFDEDFCSSGLVQPPPCALVRYIGGWGRISQNKRLYLDDKSWK